MEVIWKWLRAFALFGFSFLMMGVTLQAAPTPFVCDGTPYTVINDPSMLQYVDRTDLSVHDMGVVEEDGTNIQKYINGIAYNILDNYIYALDTSSAREIIRVGADQNLTYLGTPVAGAGSPHTWTKIKSYIGTMDSDGNFYGLGDGYLYIVNIASLTYTTKQLINKPAGYGDPADITFNVNDGMLYGTKGRNLYSFNISTGVVTEVTVNPYDNGDTNDVLPTNAGGAWSTSKGELYFYSNQDGTLTKVEVLSDGTATVDYVGSVVKNGKFDATACRPPYVTKAANTQYVTPGGQITYTYTIYNPFTKAIDVDFSDPLPSALTYDISSRTDLIDSNGDNLEPADVTTFNTTDLNISDITLPINGYVEFNVTVNIDPNLNSQSNINNVAYIHYGINTTPSDDPSTGSPGDGTSVTVNYKPNAHDDSAVTNEDTAVVINVDANDTSDTTSGTDLNLSSVTVVSGPSNGATSVNPVTGDVTYTPNANFYGTDMFTYKICDNGLPVLCDEANVTVIVNSVDDLTVVKDDSATTDEDTAVNIDVLANDTDVDTKSPVASVTQGANGTVTVNGDGTVKYTPNTNFNGTDTFTYTNDEGNTATVTVTVNPVDDPTTIVNDSATTDEDTAVNIDVLANDTDVDTKSPVASVTQGANGTVTVNGDGTVKYTPNTNFNGTDTFTYTNDEGNTATVTVTVNPVNDAPTAEDDSQSTPVNTPVSVPVLNNDHDIDGDTLIITDVDTTGTNGTVTWDANGTVIFTPNTDFIGTTTFSYTVSDGNGGTDTATVTITTIDPEDPANNAVTAVADSVNIEMNTNIDILVLTNDYDPENDDFNLTSIATAPQHGTASINNNGTPDDARDDFITYVPANNFIGTDTFEYEITDENGNTDIAIVSIRVIDPVADSVPNAVADAAMTDQNSPVTINVLDNDSHPNNDDLNITAFTQPANGVVTVDDGGTPADPSDDRLVYTPNPGFKGHDTFMYTITDSNGDTASAAVTVTVGTVPPAVGNDERNATSGEPAVIDVVGNDNPGTSPLDPATVQIIDPVNGETTHYVVPGEGTWDVDPVTGEITFTPETGYVGDPAPIEYNVYDMNGNSGTGTVVLNYGPLANDDMNDQAFEGETVTVNILENDKNTSSPLDPMSVSLVSPSGATDIVTDNDGDVVGFIVPGEGEWRVDEDTGTVTFVPDEDLLGYPTPVEYTVKEESGDESNRAMIEIFYEVYSPAPPPSAPGTGLPNATDNLDVPVSSYSPIVIDVLANGDSFGGNGAGTTEITFTQPTHGSVALDDGGTPNDPTDDVLVYTPKADVNNIKDRFTYTITDAQGNTSTATVTVAVNCASSQTSDSGDALGTLGMIMMMLMTLLSGLYFVRKEERGNI